MTGEAMAAQPSGPGHAVGRQASGFGVPAAGPQTLVSVIVDNYNYARYLPRALDSALGQTHPNVEVIVVDDASTDDTREVLAGYADRVRLLLLEENGGQARAMNAGLREARGDVLVQLDSDDVLLPDTIERAVAEFAADPDCVRVQWRLQVIDADGQPTGETVPPAGWPLLSGNLREAFLRYRVFRVPPASGNAYSAAAIRAIPPAPETVFRQSVDRWWSDLTTLLGTLRALDGVAGEYRVHGDNGSVRRGRGVEYFRSRVALTVTSHDATRDLARRHGIPGVPDDVEAALDPAFFTWLVALRKLGAPAAEVSTPSWRLGARGAYALVRRPDQPPQVRLNRLLWFLLLLAVPARTRLVQRLIDLRYSR